jgi:hypothetical protein
MDLKSFFFGRDLVVEVFQAAERGITLALGEGFKIVKHVYSPESFGSRYTDWQSTSDRRAVRLIWDGRDSWFSIEECPLSRVGDPASWSVIEVIPFNGRMASDRQVLTTVDSILQAIRSMSN